MTSHDLTIHHPDLSDKQLRCILLLLQGSTHRDAAAECGVARETVTRWTALPAFRETLTELQREQRESIQRRMEDLFGQGLRRLGEYISDQEAPDRTVLRATEQVLKLASKYDPPDEDQYAGWSDSRLQSEL